MFNNHEYKVINPITKEVLKQEVWSDWISEVETLKKNPEPRAVYYKCINEKCDKEWHSFTIYIDGVEYINSEVVDAMLLVGG